jgi:chromosome partitioning protein
MVICFVNQKGGVGKTTTAINIGASLKRKNWSVVLVDADPQGSAVQWQDVENNNTFGVLHHPGPVLPADIEELTEIYDYVLIDAPPAIDEITRSVLAVSELAVVPLSPSPLDIWSCEGTLEMISEARRQNPGLEIKLLINRKIPGTRLGREAREAVDIFDTGVFETELCQRVAFIDAMTCGVSVTQYSPGSKAAAEVESLCQEILACTVEEEETAAEGGLYAELYREELQRPELQNIFQL